MGVITGAGSTILTATEGNQSASDSESEMGGEPLDEEEATPMLREPTVRRGNFGTAGWGCVRLRMAISLYLIDCIFPGPVAIHFADAARVVCFTYSVR